MRQTLRILPYVAFVFAGVLGGAATQSAKKDTGVSKGTVYACALLTPAEIEAIQGERVEETKPTVRPSGGLFATQCLFRTPTLNKSVSLFLTASDPLHPVPLTARQLWQKQFHSSEVDEEPVAGENKKKLDPERERESREPRPIRGLGERVACGERFEGRFFNNVEDFFLGRRLVQIHRRRWCVLKMVRHGNPDSTPVGVGRNMFHYRELARATPEFDQAGNGGLI